MSSVGQRLDYATKSAADDNANREIHDVSARDVRFELIDKLIFSHFA